MHIFLQMRFCDTMDRVLLCHLMTFAMLLLRFCSMFVLLTNCIYMPVMHPVEERRARKKSGLVNKKLAGVVLLGGTVPYMEHKFC